ncbi:hypothetical protein HDE_00218 [Halotydeus destructor]|nr:hypothetical protein HDE_00218 [Halotydeus destructor]
MSIAAILKTVAQLAVSHIVTLIKMAKVTWVAILVLLSIDMLANSLPFGRDVMEHSKIRKRCATCGDNGSGNILDTGSIISTVLSGFFDDGRKSNVMSDVMKRVLTKVIDKTDSKEAKEALPPFMTMFEN